MLDFAQVFVWVMGAAIALDLFLVLVLKVKSISMATWIAAQAHPTLITAGTLVTVFICVVLVKENAPGYACFMAAMGGHLFTGIPVSPAMQSLLSERPSLEN